MKKIFDCIVDPAFFEVGRVRWGKFQHQARSRFQRLQMTEKSLA